jgi:D-alanyl-D-alanine carboxypeptidase (penicillin-binding protein 5/6)
MKKVLFLLCLAFLPCFNAAPALALRSGDLAASAAVLMDYTTGEILFAKNSDERRPLASTTKIMTAIVALERGDLRQKITVGANAEGTEGSSIWLKAGEVHELNDLLYGVLLSSGNDASVAVAEALAGSEQKFAAWMTAKAHALGAESTRFENCNGLPAPNHYTTARDLALITRYALHNPVFDEIVKTKRKTISWPGHPYDRLMINHNKLLWRYPLADGVKTGYTREAGNCLVSSATKDGHRLISVVLNSRQTYADAEALFQYGFANYQLLTVVNPKEKMGAVRVRDGVRQRVPVLANRPVTLVIPRGAAQQVQVNVALPPAVKAPVEKMQQIGELQVRFGDRLLRKVPLVSAAPVRKEGLFHRLFRWVRLFSYQTVTLLKSLGTKVFS